MSTEAPTAAEITELLAHWWHRYDEGQIEELRPYLTADATFRTRTDTGTTDWEESSGPTSKGPTRSSSGR